MYAVHGLCMVFTFGVVLCADTICVFLGDAVENGLGILEGHE